MRLAHVLEDDGFLFTRYVRVGLTTQVLSQLLQQDELALEVGGGVEVLVDAGEAQVGDDIERAQPLEHLEAELGGGDLVALQARMILELDAELFDLLGADRSTLRGRGYPGDDLGAIERLAQSVTLDDDQRHFLEPFVGRETVLAAGAQASTTNRCALFGLARIDHLGVVGMAFRATHRRPRLPEWVTAGVSA